jgi:hypothetical protein
MTSLNRRVRLLASGGGLALGVLLLLADGPPPPREPPPCTLYQPDRADFAYVTDCFGADQGRFAIVSNSSGYGYQVRVERGRLFPSVKALVDESACHDHEGTGLLAGFSFEISDQKLISSTDASVTYQATRADCGESRRSPEESRTLSCTIVGSRDTCTVKIAPVAPDAYDAGPRD